VPGKSFGNAAYGLHSVFSEQQNRIGEHLEHSINLLSRMSTCFSLLAM
jgi:hypothetical protein